MKESISETRQRHEHEKQKSASMITENEQLSQSIEQIMNEKIKLESANEELVQELRISESKRKEENEKNQSFSVRLLLLTGEIERLQEIIEKMEKDNSKFKIEEELRKDYEERIQKLLVKY
jgi:hypothetical protein